MVPNNSQDAAHAKDEELKFSGVNFDYLAVRKLTQRNFSMKSTVGKKSTVSFDDALDEDKLVNEAAEQDEKNKEIF